MTDSEYRQSVSGLLEKHYGFVEQRTLESIIKLRDTRGMILTPKQVEDLKKILKIQGDHGNWNHDSYMQGMYNGMELMMATIEGREPEFRKAPKQWLADIKLKGKSTVETKS